MTWINRIWYGNSPLAYLLAPIAAVYRCISKVRRHAYQVGLYKAKKFPVPVIIVGNITVGGTGKTPLVVWLANFLQQKGYRPGLVSRGYGGRAVSYPQRVITGSDPSIVGDEAVMLVQQTSCPMVVAPNRCLAVETLLAAADCNVIISDDGLQHYALARDIEIAVIDGSRKLGNGFCLPAGPLREPKSRLKGVDLIVMNGIAEKPELGISSQKPAFFSMQVKSGTIYNLMHPKKKLNLTTLYSQPIHAVAGIGNPDKFFQLLEQMQLKFEKHIFPDHYYYQQQDFNFPKNAIIIMTEKDAVKCKRFADKRFWCLPITAELEDSFAHTLLAFLR